MANEGGERVEVVRASVVPVEDSRAVCVEDLGGERALPATLAPCESLRLWTPARELATRLDRAGYGGTPRLAFVVRDGEGRTHEKRFRFRAGEYLNLRDE